MSNELSSLPHFSNAGDPSAAPAASATEAIQPSPSEVYIWLIPIGAFVVHLGSVQIGGYQLTGFLWVMYLLAGLLLYQIQATLSRESKIHFPVMPWCVWYGFVWLSMLWAPRITGRNIQDAMMITMPLVVGVVASMTYRHAYQLRNLLSLFVVVAALLFLRCVLGIVGVFPEDALPGNRCMAISAVMISCVCLAQSSRAPLYGYAGWFLCMLIAAGTVSRTATAILLMLPVMNPLYRNKSARVGLILAACVASIAVFYSPQFQERFFYSGSGTLMDVWQGNFLSFGRFEAWPAIIDEAMSKPWLGHGVGTVIDFVPLVWEEEDKPHNEFIRVLFECGLVGVFLFVSVMFWQVCDLYRRMQQSEGLSRVAFAAGMLACFGFGLLACTDNVLIYNLFYNNMHFALMGAVYGVAAAEAKRQRQTPSQANAPSHLRETAE